MFLKNKNIIFKIRRSKVTDYAALRTDSAMSTMNAINLDHNHEQDEKKVFSMVLITRYDYSMFNLSK